MSFRLGLASRRELKGVHPQLVRVVERAIELTTQDFTVHDGVRTLEEQKALVARGASKTMNSRHLIRSDGFGHAVDLVPWINGKPRWEWEPIFDIAFAMQTAARELGVNLRWGGVWDRTLNDLAQSPEGLEDEVEDYVTRRRAAGQKSVFIDGPHYELLS